MAPLEVCNLLFEALTLAGLWTAITAVVEQGDEVIVFSPWFDIYEGSVACVGAKLVQVPLRMQAGATHSSGKILHGHHSSCQDGN